jgi:TRAP-type C4-dicarboxylate transport system permease small subunit
MLFLEVVARYIFNAPTIWTQDVAITCQVWMTYLGMAYVLRQRQLIRIVAIASLFGPRMRKALEGFSLLVIIAFGMVAVVYGGDMVADSIRLGRRQPTMLEMPNWITELPVVIGFAFLSLQAVADLIRLPFRPAPDFNAGAEHAVEEEGR